MISRVPGLAGADRPDRTDTTADRHPDLLRSPTSMFSSTVRSSNTPPDWNVRASPCRARTCAGSESSRAPSKRTSPEYLAKPVSASTNVVFPAPLGPISPTNPPAGTLSDTESSATTPP